MYILSQDKEQIVNTDAVKVIYKYYESIYAGCYKDDYKIAQYDNDDKAKKVLRQIFNAMKNGDTTFEMPED